jgi:LuxR family transcriptional regulator, maltose regulon positive regulatory protein
LKEPVAYQDSLLVTKLQFPTSMHRLVSRPRLLERLRQGIEGKLTLICAPAGSGKTTLFIEWLQSAHGDDLPVAWVSLDKGDNDPARFWRYICAALERIDASVGERMLALLHTSSLSIEAILIQLMNLLVERARPFVLLLDDYHLITTAQIHQALKYLLDHMPPLMHLVIMTRVEPPIPLARLRARRQVVEVRDADLRFTLEEADSLLREVMELPLAPKQIQALARRTEGWVVGLQLAALAMHDRTDLAEFISTFTGSNRYIVDYLMEEVISRQPADVQTFLLSTAILSRLCASLCASVLGGDQMGQEETQREESTAHTPDSTRQCQQMLERLERANLFIVPLDQERRWYRYHHLVAEVLLGRLHHLHPSLVAELHLRASDWYEQHDFLHEALEHALAAKDFSRTARLVEQAAPDALGKGMYLTLLRWVEAIPEQQIRRYPRMCLIYAWALIMSGSERREAIDEWIQEGMRHLPEDQAVPDEMAGEVASLRANAAAFRGETVSTITLAQQALRQLPADHWLQGLLAVLLGFALMLTGSAEEATRALTRAINICQAHRSQELALMAKGFLGNVLVQQGRLHQATGLYQEVIQEVGDQPSRSVLFAYGGLGDILRERNELDAARSLLQQGCELHQDVGRIVRTALVVYIPLARLQWAQRDGEGAFASLALVERLAHAASAQRPLAMIAALRAQLLLRQGDITSAARWSETRGLSAKDLSSLLYQPDPREFEYTALARLFIAQGRYEEARKLLEGLLRAAQAAGRGGSVIEILILQALAEEARGASRPALAILGQALTLAEPEGYIRVFADEGEPMSSLLSQLHPTNQHLHAYVQTLLAACYAPTIEHKSLAELPPATEGTRLQQPLLEPLSDRELEVLHLLADGATNAEIAEQLFITSSTVKRHLSNIYSKLAVANRTQAVARARALGIL